MQGANKHKPCLLLPWLAVMALNLVILSVSILVMIGFTIYWAVRDPTAGVNNIMVAVTLLCAFLLGNYL